VFEKNVLGLKYCKSNELDVVKSCGDQWCVFTGLVVPEELRNYVEMENVSTIGQMLINRLFLKVLCVKLGGFLSHSFRTVLTYWGQLYDANLHLYHLQVVSFRGQLCFGVYNYEISDKFVSDLICIVDAYVADRRLFGRIVRWYKDEDYYLEFGEGEFEDLLCNLKNGTLPKYKDAEEVF
jgi:hypothetical protein